MTLSAAPQPRAIAATVEQPAARLPAWPVLALLWGMPVWWAAGLLSFSSVILAIPMAALLLMRRIALPPGLLPWFAFVVWMLPCALMLESTGRLLGFAVRFSQFAAVAVILLYVAGAAATLTVRRLVSGLTFTWVFVIVGGWLGLLVPEATLTQTVGQLLPGSLRDDEYIGDLVFPSFAEIQTPYGAAEPFVRPSAPYAYANGWGAAMSILTPIAVANATLRRTLGSVAVLVLGIFAAIPPAVASSNRGLYAGLAIAVLYALARFLVRGAWLSFAVGVLLSAAVTVALLMSGVVAAITDRQETVDTTEGRSLLYQEAFERTLESPILGWGAPRPSSWSEITVGTQGMLWSVMFCFGFVGLALFLWFIVGGLVRTVHVPDVTGIWLHASVATSLAMCVFYGLDRHMVTIGIVLALLLRERYDPDSTWWTRERETVRARAP